MDSPEKPELTLRQMGDAYMEQVTKLFLESAVRYEEQAELLYENGVLLVPVNSTLVKYYFDGVGIGSKVSHDQGKNFSESLSWHELGTSKVDNVENIKWHYAGSEASSEI